MSGAPNSPAELIHAVSSVITQSRISIAAAVVFAYEYAITLDQEVSLFWMRRKTGATGLFLLIRYMALLSLCLLNAATYAPMSDESCSLLNKVQAPLQIAGYFPWAVFSGMRALALSGMNWTFASIVFAFAVVPFAVNVWIISLGVTGSNFPVVGCGGGSNATKHDTLIATPLSRACAIVADVLVIAATWRYALKGGVLRRDTPGVTPSRIANALVYNGTIYFIVLVILNVLHVTLTLLSIVQLENPSSEVSIFTDPLTAILIGRYLMALQSANQKVLGSATDQSHARGDGGGDAPETLRFVSRVIGSLGATITGADADVDEGDSSLEWREGDEAASVNEDKVVDEGAGGGEPEPEALEA